MKRFYKLAMPSGFDFYTGNTINYRESIGKTVRVPTYRIKKNAYELCSEDVLHACPDPNDCFIGAKIPCSAYIFSGKPVVGDGKKYGFKSLKVIEEIPQCKLDELFGWKYSEAVNPIHPFKIVPPTICEEQLALLRVWVSVRDSVGVSVGVSVWDSVGISVGVSVVDSVRDSVGVSVGVSVVDSVRDSVGDSVRDSVRAYIGNLFPRIKVWKYVEHVEGQYPFQPAVDLWKQGLVPSYDGKVWRLHGGANGAVLWEGKLPNVRKSGSNKRFGR